MLLLPKPLDLALLVGTLSSSTTPSATNACPQASESTWSLEVVGRDDWGSRLPALGYVGAADAREAMGALALHLAGGPCRLEVDLRGVTGFSVAGASAAQKAIWPNRHSILHVTIAGGPLPARIVSSAACHLFGIGCTMEEYPRGDLRAGAAPS